MSKKREIEIAQPKDREVISDILHQKDLQNELKILKNVLKASYGPTGRLNLIQNVNGGHVTISSTSSCLLNSFTNVSSPVTQLILKTIKGHLNTFDDGGLFLGLVTLELLDSCLKSSLPRHITIMINEHALQIILDHVNNVNNKCCHIQADISNISQMIAIINTIIATKCVIGISLSEMNQLAILLLRGFLGCIPSSEMTNKSVMLENMMVCECEGGAISDSKLVNGVLLGNNMLSDNLINNDDVVTKVVVFDCSLAGNVDDKWFDKTQSDLLDDIPNIEHHVLVLMKQMVDKLLTKGVKLVACQKVIHPTLQQYLISKGMYFIERLSITHIDIVEKLTGATKLSTYQLPSKNFGSLASIKELVVGKNRFLHLLPHESVCKDAISTLLLCAPDEAALNELVLCSRAVLTSLKHLIHYPYLVPGAGCFEAHIAGLLCQEWQHKKQFPNLDCTGGQLQEGLSNIAATFLQISKTIDHDKYDHYIDTILHHHWMNQPSYSTDKQLESCLCHTITSNSDTEWQRLEEVLHNGEHHEIKQSYKTLNTSSKSSVLDIMKTKISAIKTAFEIVSIILRVKHFVKEII